MTRGIVYGLIACICLIYPAYGQLNSATEQCGMSKKHLFASAGKTTVLSAEEDLYDVQYVKFDISLTDQSTAISGSVLTRAKVLANNLSQYAFELDTTLTIDSVKINGLPGAILNSGVLHKVILPVSQLQNTVFTAQVYYHGIPPAGNAIFTNGLNNDTASGTRVTFTMSEPYTANQWWPCKQSLQDKIDSADIWVTVPENLKAGSNGLLRSVTPMSGNRSRYEWKTHYPIDYYLLSASVASYIDYSYYTTIPGTTDSMLIQNYVYSNPTVLPFYKPQIDSVGLMIQYLSELFGPYPFYKEKYGHCITPLFGGMEHQTMTTLRDFGALLVVHELGHQWFGDHVTCATWQDIWLNEGFASYIEYLFVNHFYGVDRAAAHMQGFHNRVLAPDAQWGSVYVDDTTSANRIFDGKLSYAKGAAVIHSLRFLFNNDSLFFSFLKAYQQKFAFGTATTAAFQSLAEQWLGQDLSVFFYQWIYRQGYPVYSASWNKVYDKVFIQLNQSSVIPQSIDLYKTPIELKLLSPQGDTTVRVYNDNASQLYTFSWSKPMNGIVIDPNNWILNRDAGVKRDYELGLDGFASNTLTAFPNPSFENWHLLGLSPGSSIMLTDISGRILWTGYSNLSFLTIPGGQLSSGIYILHILRGSKGLAAIKLVKQ
jgi:aminopeptidase N